MSLLGWIILGFVAAVGPFYDWLSKRSASKWSQEPEPLPVPVPQPEVPADAQETPVKPAPEPQTPTYLWDTPANARHSVRVICDEEGLTLDQKNTLCATIGAESGWKTTARLDNKDKNGKVWSTDWGICQWNDYWHWERTKEISPEEAVHNPEKAVRLMCTYWKQGLRNQWVAYSSGAYKAYLS